MDSFSYSCPTELRNAVILDIAFGIIAVGFRVQPLGNLYQRWKPHKSIAPTKTEASTTNKFRSDHVFYLISETTEQAG